MKTRIRQNLNKSLLIIMLFSSSFMSWAGKVEVEGMNTDLTTDLTVLSNRYTDFVPGWETSFGVKEVKNEIIFGIDKDVLQVDAAYEYKIAFDLTWEELDGAILVSNSATDIELKLNYDPDGQYQDQELYAFNGAVKMTIDNIRLYKWDVGTATFVLTALDRDNLFLKGKIVTESYDNFSYLAIPTGTPSLSIDGSDILVDWSDMPAAEAYDLEWTWINAYDGEVDAGEATLLPEAGLFYNFKTNASRIRINASEYRIPMIYGDGYILVRYRGVGRILNHLDVDVDGQWTNAAQGNVAAFTGGKILVDAFENNIMNYGASMTFVEAGKRNTTLNYMDGVMKSRQSISQLNSQEELLVSSAIYDYYGRPAIGVMGSPVKETELGYVENLNMFDATTPYDKAVFHQDNLMFEDCFSKPAPPMDALNSKGSANYYSEYNSNKEGVEAFLPEANGYNFTQIHYTNDATGRVKRVGSVGPDHQLDGTVGHYTETIFDIPDNREVDSLLGAEAADVVNYTKVITKDVHGQISVAIIDNMGRTVISYLEGDAPMGLEAIEGNDGLSPVSVDLVGLTSESSDLLDQGILQVEKKIAVTDPNVVYTFNYDFTALSFTDCLPPDICFDCIYEIEFEVTSTEAELSGACGLTDGTDNPIATSWTHTLGSVESFDISCDDPLKFSEEHPTASSFTLKFPAFGAYYVRKTLRVAQEPIEYYWEQYIENADESCLIPYENFLANAMSEIDFGDCYDGSPCELNFLYEHGTLEEYIAATGETEAEYNTLKEEFVENCENQPICAQMRPILLADISPGGQYGDISGASGLSVFNAADPMVENWRTVTFLNPDASPAMTIDDDGAPIPVNHISIGLTEFIAEYWQSHFAEQLLEAHPEYETYRFCELYPEVFDYALEFKTTETYAEALAAGFITPVDPNPSGYYADCFSGSPVPYDAATADPLILLIDGALATVLSTPSYIYDNSYIVSTNDYLEACHDIFGTSIGPTTFYQTASVMTDGEPFGASSCDVDAQWEAFRDLYLARRNILLQIAMEGRAIQAAGAAWFRCIYYNEPSFCDNPPTYDYAAYASKNKRFIVYDEAMPFPLIQLLEGDAAAIIAMEDEAEADGIAFCASTCESMAENWMTELADCATDMIIPPGQVWESGDDPENTFYENLKAELIEVCQGGCSPEFPFPSQYHNDPPSAELTSFQTVIEQYLPGGLETVSCNHYLIDMPSAAAPIPITPALDTCACNKLLSVTDEADFEMEFDFVPINFCRDRATCADISGLSLGSTYPRGSIAWTSPQLLLLEEELTPTNYGCNGDGCIDCAELEQAIINFALAFPTASIEEDIVMFTSFVNEMYGTSLDYYSIMTFKDHCDSITAGGIITEGFTSTAYAFRDYLNVLIAGGGLATSQIVDNIELPGFIDEISDCPGDETGDIIHTGTYSAGVLYMPMENFLSGSSGTSCQTCSANELLLFPDATSLAGSPYDGDPIGAMDNVIEFELIYMTAADLAAYPALDKFHITALVSHPMGEDPFLMDFQIQSRNCLNFIEPFNELCGNLFPEIEDDCVDALIATAEMEADMAYGEYLTIMKEQFIADYIEICRGVEEEYNYHYQANRYHYTLAYYDRAANLVKTVPPKGIVGLSSTEIDEVQLYRAGEIGGVPHLNNHTFVTEYYYNALNQPIQTITPDGGTSNFWYDYLARMVVSQNAKQANNLTSSVIAGDPLAAGTPTQAYSYSRFDELGRPIEFGEFVQPTPITQAIAKNPVDLHNWLYETGINRYRNQVTQINYTNPTSAAALSEFGTEAQGDIRNRVSSVSTVQGYVQMDGIWSFPTPDYLNHYAYDVHGNVSTHLQENTDLADDGRQFFRTDYVYDLLTGLPHYSHFQKGKEDQFSHHYVYDADNRIKEVYTSKESIIWDRDAEYNYRLDGKLTRTELGELKVQGLDHAYTLQGWLKAMNSMVLDPIKDMGKDGRQFSGSLASLSSDVAQDALAYTLGYYNTDYEAIDSDPMNQFLGTTSGTTFGLDVNELFNGNIAHTTTAMMDLDENPIAVTGTAYRYDQLHRLKETHVFTANDITDLNSFVNADRRNISASLLPGISPALGDYEVRINYDPNGNILELDRRAYDQGAVDNQMDAFSYDYPAASTNNLLGRVKDDATGTAYDDIKEGQLSGNYDYHSDGTLKSDDQEDIAYLEWYPNGKLKKVHRESDSERPDLYFEYDAMGNRVLKVEIPKDGSGEPLPETQWNKSWYGMDANGVAMGIYQKTEAEPDLHKIESTIYGAKRHGLDTRLVPIIAETYSLGDLEEDMPCGAVASWYMNQTPGTTYSVGDVNTNGMEDLTVSHATSTNFLAMQTINTIIGETYTVSYDIIAQSVPWVRGRAKQCSGGGNLGVHNASATGSYSYTFVATTLKSRVMWYGDGSTGSFSLENINISGPGDIYGLSLLAEGEPNVYHRIIGEKMYELGDHLGNVKEVITDRKIVKSAGPVNILDDFSLGNPCITAGEWFLSAGTTYTLIDVNADEETDLESSHTSNYYISLNINTEIGESYTVSYDILAQTAAWVYGRGKTCPGAGTVLGLHNASAPGSYSYTFTATTTQSKVMWFVQGIPPGGGGCTLGNISISGPGDPLGTGAEELLVLLPDVVSFKDYYPFGMEMPGRKGALSGAEGYRYAFNGMEQDQELSGSGNSYTTMFRQYDPRIGRWKSIDPLAAKYPGASPYSAYNNNPIYFVDPLGLEGMAYENHGGGDEWKSASLSKEEGKKAGLDEKEGWGIVGNKSYNYNEETGNWDFEGLVGGVQNVEGEQKLTTSAPENSIALGEIQTSYENKLKEQQLEEDRKNAIEGAVNALYDQYFPADPIYYEDPLDQAVVDARRQAIKDVYMIAAIPVMFDGEYTGEMYVIVMEQSIWEQLQIKYESHTNLLEEEGFKWPGWIPKKPATPWSLAGKWIMNPFPAYGPDPFPIVINNPQTLTAAELIYSLTEEYIQEFQAPILFLQDSDIDSVESLKINTTIGSDRLVPATSAP